MEVFIKSEVNGRFIIRNFQYYLHMDDFFKRFVNPRKKEGYELISFDEENHFLILKKDDEIIRCFW